MIAMDRRRYFALAIATLRQKECHSLSGSGRKTPVGIRKSELVESVDDKQLLRSCPNIV
jgi:hypothetical protein